MRRSKSISYSFFNSKSCGIALIFLILIFIFSSCEQSDLLQPSPVDEHDQVARINATEFEGLLSIAEVEEVDVKTNARIGDSGYHARATCSGIIPSGEYAGQRFFVYIYGHYSGLGPGTLIDGSASIWIGRGNRFVSVDAPELMSFCCGEGGIYDLETHYEFTIYGQVKHGSAATEHNHLFAAFGSTLELMNFNIADQSGTITEPLPGGVAPHDPGIGLILDVPTRRIFVRLVP